jgi:hypothetical protein
MVKGMFVKLTINARCDIVVDMEISSNGHWNCLRGDGPVRGPLFLSQIQRKTASDLAAFFVCRTVGGRDFCGPEMSMANNSLQKTAKTASRTMRRLTPSAGVFASFGFLHLLNVPEH